LLSARIIQSFLKGNPTMRARIFLGGAALTLLCGQAVSNDAYSRALAELEANALQFTAAQNYVTVDSDKLTGEHYYSAKNFPGVPNPPQLSLPDADLDPLTRSIVILEANEPPLPHVRYRVTYSMDVSPDMPEVQQAYAEVTRYNLGPSRREDLLMSVPDGQVADPVEFGVGPHISWRFALAPVMGMRAGLVYASRTEVPEAQARTADCLGEPCLSVADPSGPVTGWEPMTSSQSDPPPYAGTTDSGVATAAFGMQELWENLTADGMDPLRYMPTQPHFVFVISVNVAGQEGLVKQAEVMDDSVSEIWTRRLEIAGVPAEFSRLLVPRRARQ
jgi:hypothetical protein